MRIKERLAETIKYCDGFSYVTEKEAEDDYKAYYHNVIKEGKTMFPFIYITTIKYGTWIEKTMVFIPKKKYIFLSEDGTKTY